MKKALVILLIIIMALAPAVVFSQVGPSLEDLYIAEDTILSDYVDTYTALLESMDSDMERYENMRLARGRSFYVAKSMAVKENGILQINFNIENAYDAIKAREAKLSIDFRNSYINLYLVKISSADANLKAFDSKTEYENIKKGSGLSYISANELSQLEYKYMSYYYDSLAKKRHYESVLRTFNFITGNPLDYDEYEFNFSETIIPVMSVEFYIDSALNNSPSIKYIKQRLEKYYNEKKYYDQYSLATNLGYIADALRDLEINTRLQELQLQATKENLAESIAVKYDAILIEMEKIDLAALNIEILQQEYETAASLYNRGYIGKQELSDSSKLLADAEDDCVISIYKYNTQIKSLENDCAYYPKESESQ